MMKRLWILVLLSVSALADADSLIEAVDLNQQGIEHLQKQNFSAAENAFVKGLMKAPFLAELQLNLGLSFYGAGEMEKAQASYEGAARMARSEETQFVAYYNLGELMQKAKKTDLALEAYQQALKIKPDSRETKVNIELLIQQQQQQEQKSGGQGDSQSPSQPNEQKDQSGQGDQDKKEQNGEGPKTNPKAPKPQFNSKELDQADVNKILGEIKQQEQKIRAEFNRKDAKERPRDKDW